TAAAHRKSRGLASLMDAMVFDVLEHAATGIEVSQIDSPEAARAHSERLITFSPHMASQQKELRDFLSERVYRHPATLRMQAKVGEFFRKLFVRFHERPELLPLAQQAR